MHATAPIPPSAMRQNNPRPISVVASTHSADAMFPPIPPNPSSPPAVRFDQDSPFAIFMNHSPHRVIYRGVQYPTAAHLFEAMKFIDSHPDIADDIRACPDVQALYPLTNQYSSSIRPDWPYMHLQAVCPFPAFSNYIYLMSYGICRWTKCSSSNSSSTRICARN